MNIELDPDEIIFRDILSFINEEGRKKRIAISKQDITNRFGDEIKQFLFRLREKQFLRYDEQDDIFYISDLGIKELDTTYNEDYRRSEHQKEIEKENLEKDKTLWMKIGITVTAITSVIAIIISLLAYFKE